MNSSLNVQISSNSKLELNKEYRIENEEYQPAAYGEWKKISGDNLGSFGFASQNIAENSLNVNLGNINNNDDGNNNYNIPANNINNTLEQNPQN
jgi:hypothetical protein